VVDPLSETVEPSKRSTLDVELHRRGLRIVECPDRTSIGRLIECRATPLVIGRGTPPPNHIPDPAVSREHARLIPGGGALTIEHAGGKSGTFVNTQRLTGPQVLTDGDIVTIGDTLLVVDHSPSPDHLPAADNASTTSASELIGVSLYTERLRRAIDTLARGGGHVLLLGETGTGKEVAARALHRASGRRGAFIAVNCAALPSEIAESELFGHKKGAFTGAARDREGFFVEAAGGTLFLDEIGDLLSPIQAKLLRVLEDGLVQPLGGSDLIRVDVRVVCATQPERADATLRSDLLARISEWTLELSPLAMHRADILALWRHFEETEGPPPPRTLTTDLAEQLLLYDWPQNVRELRNLRRRLSALAGTKQTYDLSMLPKTFRQDRSAAPQKPVVSAGTPAKETLEALLLEYGGNVRRMADERGWHRTQIYRWAKRYGIDIERVRREPEE
jgi:two-component system, NtrC family, response regulator